LVVAAALVLAVFAASYLLNASRSRPADRVAPAAVTTTPQQAGAATADRLLLVVLPFEDLSGSGDPFTAGLSEEIRSRLASLDGLGVISRATSRKFAEDRPPVPDLAEELGVDYVVDGTVRWQTSASGEWQVRVTPQLILAAEDRQLWTHSYDSTLADVLDLQSEIARQVAERLDLELLEPHRRSLAARPTDDIAAWSRFVEAEDAFERGRDLQARDDVLSAIGRYQEAVARDPGFALAHARLGEAHAYLYFYSMDPSEERLSGARAATTRALELQPDLPEGHFALGLIRVSEGDGAAGLAEWDVATRVRPNYAEAYWASSMSLSVAGLWNEAFEAARKATELNPRASRHYCQMGGMSQALGRYSDAIGYHDRAISVTPERACPYFCLLEVHMSRGDLVRARQYIEALPSHLSLEENPAIAYYDVMLHWIEGHPERALERLATGDSDAYEAPWFYRPKSLFAGHLHAALGDPERARAGFLEAAVHLERRVADSPFDIVAHSALANASAALGRSAEARDEDSATLELLPRLEGVAGPYVYRELAHGRLLLGDADGALALLERHLSYSRYLPAAYLRLDPTLAPLRGDPRFEELLARHARGPGAGAVAQLATADLDPRSARAEERGVGDDRAAQPAGREVLREDLP
jgi:TolB-like protein/Flp pilus assembly protein TadD